MDDDARVADGFVSKVLETIHSGQFDCFGGTYYAWHKYGKPEWLPADFGNKPEIRKDVGEVPEGLYLSGGILFFR
ncbi:hypothetical protein RZS08_53170, partial [Arthrospira platensis SPKY1]|nr:hypothetical protein [Arthrospira platensis SPKY1]